MAPDDRPDIAQSPPRPGGPPWDQGRITLDAGADGLPIARGAII
jgi:hypothetical protein